MNENLTPPSIPDMLKVTGANTAAFMQHVAEHVDKLEQTIVELTQRIAELEGSTNGTK